MCEFWIVSWRQDKNPVYVVYQKSLSNCVLRIEHTSITSQFVTRRTDTARTMSSVCWSVQCG